MELMFGLQIKVEDFYDLILSFWLCAARHVQNTQNNKFTISLQYLIENVKDEVKFLQADRLKSFLQVDSITLGVRSQTCPKYPK